MKHKMKVAKLQSILGALQALGQQKLPIGYEIAKNIRRCEQALAETNDVVKALVRKHAVKRPDGEPSYEVRGDRMFPVFDEENRGLYAAEIRKVDEESVEVDLHRVLVARLEGIPVEGSLLAPLLGYVFVESVEEPAPKERETHEAKAA
jgi:hypothetical protein